MPLTPVGQIPYPLSSDKPLIPTDMKNLATTTDGWVSGLDVALDTRVKAVGTRLDTVATQLGTTTTNLAAANARMGTGDTAISSEQAAQLTVTNRLATQDTTANTLQNRYNNDSRTLTVIELDSPLGVITGQNPGLNWSYVSGNQVIWVAQQTFFSSYYAPVFRVFFNTAVAADTNTQIDMRLCWATGTSANFYSGAVSRSFFSSTTTTTEHVSMSCLVYGIGSGQMTIGAGMYGSGNFHYGSSTNFSIQLLTERV